MQAELKVRNIVLVGIFPISHFDKHYFIKNNIIAEDDIVRYTVENNTVHLISNTLTIKVTLAQIIVTASFVSVDNNTFLGAVQKVAEASMGSDIPVTSIGFNFVWFIGDTARKLPIFSKELLFNEHIPFLNKYFNSSDTVYGTYASTNFRDSRLRLEAKPGVATETIGNEKIQSEVLQFHFNFHFELIKRKLKISELLKGYEVYDNHTEEIIKTTVQ